MLPPGAHQPLSIYRDQARSGEPLFSKEEYDLYRAATDRLKRLIELVIGKLLARGGNHEQREAWPRTLLLIEGTKNIEWIVNGRPAPSEPRLRHLEITPRRGTAADDLDACRYSENAH